MRARMRGTGIKEFVGNHGLEWEGSARSRVLQKRVAIWNRKILSAMQAGTFPRQGVGVENKNLSLSVHYRQAKNPAQAKREILAFLKPFPGIYLIEGKYVINVLPDRHVNKGTAVLALKRRFHCEKMIFVGDDKTDEYAFALKKKSFLLDVRIGKSKASRARYFLPNQKAIDRFLRALIQMRASRS